jgi:hypothetical protein
MEKGVGLFEAAVNLAYLSFVCFFVCFKIITPITKK